MKDRINYPMNVLHPPDTFGNLNSIKRQRWLYWNVPTYFAALWIRYGQASVAEGSTMIWEELTWPVDLDLKNVAFEANLARATCFLVGIDVRNLHQTIRSLAKLKTASEKTCTDFGRGKADKLFLIVLCFDADSYLKSALIELGADYVIDRIESVPSITKMITKNGRSFASTAHPFLPLAQ